MIQNKTFCQNKQNIAYLTHTALQLQEFTNNQDCFDFIVLYGQFREKFSCHYTSIFGIVSPKDTSLTEFTVIYFAQDVGASAQRDVSLTM